MAYRNLDEFLTRLEQAGDVAHFAADPAHPSLPEFAARDAGKAHLLAFPDGTRIVRNLFGTPKRIEQALRVASFELIAERLEQLLEIGKPGAVGAMVARAMTMFSAIRTTTNRRAPNEFQRRTFEEWRDSLPALALARGLLDVTLLTGGDTPRMAGVSAEVTDGSIIGKSWRGLHAGETVALVIGGDPAFMFAAHAPLPDIIHRSYFASWLRDKPLDMMRLPGLDIEIPSNAECIITASVTEQNGEAIALEVTAVWVKQNPIYLHLLDTERDYVRDAFVEIMLPVIKRFLPGVQRMRLRKQFGILTVDPSKADRRMIERQLWAVPISEGIAYWVMLPEIDDTGAAIEQLTSSDIVEMSKLVSGGTTPWVLLDASSKPDRLPSQLSDADTEIEYILGLFRNNWRRSTD